MGVKIRRRHVFHIAGYDAIEPVQQHRRFVRHLRIFQNTWNLASTSSDIDTRHQFARWTVETQGTNWEATTCYELFAWDQIVTNDAKRGNIERLWRAGLTYLNLMATGTLWRYAKANVRYFLFALFPMAQIFAFVCASSTAAYAIVSLWDLQQSYRFVAFLVLTVLFFGTLIQLLAGRWKLQQALDDWILAKEYIYGQRADVDLVLQSFAERLIACVRENSVDEVVLVGHSLGALLAVETVALALRRDPDFARRGVNVGLLTVGATIPKCTLHPAADAIRNRVNQVANEKSITWAEFQARADAISFYRFDPVRLTRIRNDSEQPLRSPIIRRVQIKDVLSTESFAKYRYRILRLHYQFVLANERPSNYDYYMMICGPIAFREWTGSPLGFLDFLEPDGKLKSNGWSHRSK